MSQSCPFCTLPRERILHENAHAVAIRDGYPVSPGHTLIIPKRHIASFFETTAEEKQDLLELLEVAKKNLTPPPPGGDSSPTTQGRTNDPSVANATAPLLGRSAHNVSPYEIGGVPEGRGGQKPPAFNIGINDGAAAGQTVPHLHIHLIPRYAGDVEDPRGGVRWVIPDKAKYW
jgi:diadenosine tetraphosphate (Ap4A) HIT family hydrolase